MGPRQKTIREKVVFSGKALQTGRKSRLVCRPAEAGEGISFRRMDLEGAPRVRLSDAIFSGALSRRSTIGTGKVQVQTVEHFMAALWALGVDNMEAEIEGEELPAVDGSALGFLRPLKDAGSVEQRMAREYIKILRPIEIREKESSISIMPAEKLSVSYFIDYGECCVKKGKFEIDLDGDSFEREIAPARTFCMKKEALLLFLSGMGRGATLKNTLVLGKRGPLGTQFRLPDEPVRHKVLDIVGDLYMLGRPVLGRIKAERSGHRLNSMLVKKIYEEYVERR
jgi:UDP-3-O-acyl N-acetylglucosamine deacetylase